MAKYHILSESNFKADKSAGFGWLTATLQLAPGRLSGHEVCPDRGHCFRTCVFYAGRGGMDAIQQARVRRTKLLFENNDAFYYLLCQDINKVSEIAEREEIQPAVRLNTFSDVAWEELMPQLFIEYPGVQFYDYTKSVARAEAFSMAQQPPTTVEWPSNYHLTYSWSEKAPDHMARWKSLNIALPMRENRQLPPALEGRQTVDGDQHDAIFLHPPGSVLVLKPKGPARTQRTEFIP